MSHKKDIKIRLISLPEKHADKTGENCSLMFWNEVNEIKKIIEVMKININHNLKNSRHKMFREQNDLKRDVIEFRKEFRNKRLKYYNL